MMEVVNVHAVKAHLSVYLSKVEQGETVIIARRNKAIAELRPISAALPAKKVGQWVWLKIKYIGSRMPLLLFPRRIWPIGTTPLGMIRYNSGQHRIKSDDAAAGYLHPDLVVGTG
jgi:Antitoxin of toxin-antitoxin stability system